MAPATEPSTPPFTSPSSEPTAPAPSEKSSPPRSPYIKRIMLTGDVMLGRGIDMILPFSCSPELYESCVTDAWTYTQLAVNASGALPKERGLPFEYPWGFALDDMEAKAPDVRVINLETAVTTHDTPWPRKGINYRMHPGNIPTITAAQIDVCTLANNHTLDWCEPGLAETLTSLHSAGIKTAGAGLNAVEATSPAIIPLPTTTPTHPPSEFIGYKTESRVLVWAFGHPSSGVPAPWEAQSTRPGVAFLPDFSEKTAELVHHHVAAHKQNQGDIAVCSIHWGSNWGYDIPEEQSKFAHRLIDLGGVDILHGHSSHHVKGAEVYKGKLILYGCGDLVSDYEGIRNPSVQKYYPPEEYRDTLGLVWYCDVDVRDGSLKQLIVTPTKLRKLQLTRPESADLDFMNSLLVRECCGALGAIGVTSFNDGTDSMIIQY